MKKEIMAIFEREYTPLEKALAFSSALMLGIILGFIFSPIKKGISIGSKNGCNNHHNGCKNHVDADKKKRLKRGSV